MSIFGTIAGAIAGPLFNAITGRKKESRDRSAQNTDLVRQRAWQLDDRDENFRRQRAAERRATRREREVSERERNMARRRTVEQRKYDRSQVKEARKYNRGALERIREDAAKAGFNPLTALGVGGVPQSSYAGGAMVNPAISGSVVSGSYGGGEWQPVALPPLASTGFVGDAIGAGLQTWFNRDQIAADEQAAYLQNQLMRAELQRIQNEPAEPYRDFGFSIPQVVGTGVSSTGTASEAALPSLLDPVADPVTTEPLLKKIEVSPGNTTWVPQADDADEFVLQSIFAAPQMLWNNPLRLDRVISGFMNRSQQGSHWDFGSRGAQPQ